MPEKSSIFDMIGPVMIGPSSSHTAGVVRIGRVARHILGAQPVEAQITFYNSFASTYEGHGSDRAILAGLLDFRTDDVRIKNALDLAKEAGLKYQFKPIGNASTMHPNTIKLQLTAADGKQVEVVGESRGGGLINIAQVNGFTANFSAQLQTLIIRAEDKKGAIAFVADILAQEDCNIATMTVSRKGRNDLACHFIEMDSGIRPLTLQYLSSLAWIKEITYLIGLD
ncbi:L-serine dehydratase [Flexibacter flexilis DSM 6793]|uniref:L-serine dehydratase n=1 Tax=Flexibacter flexilis DSM 6793 TaxID=927664 RepID=A0A1I1N4I0_9BACT|nr:L-serine ammonia-lyase, iron-sulfur-dependent subunit beta [Flexibacter flexilis]SFC88700.1 L-serine dehydratase [Flexibacter flexilis DSM 6793]